MIEIASTRHNPHIDPVLQLWGWEIPVYLFLGGLVAGLMILSGYHIVRSQYDREEARGHYVTAPLLSLVLLSAGMLALFLDLEHKLQVWRLYVTFQVASPMSWGSWILLLVYPALAASTLVTLPEAMPGLCRRVPGLGALCSLVRGRPAVIQAVGVVNVAAGVLLGVYTGILLSALGARPLWNSALLGPLFLFSGLSTGAATMHMLSHLSRRTDEFSDAVVSALVHWVRPKDEQGPGSAKLVHADNSFLTLEFGMLVLYLIGLASSTQVHQEAVRVLLTGSYAAAFWIFVVCLGILLPLTLQFLQANHRIRPSLAPAILVLCGGLALRIIFVFAGQATGWSQLQLAAG